MSTDYPQLIDPWRAADESLSVQGQIPLSQLPGLHAKLVVAAIRDEHIVEFSADFHHDDHGRPVIGLSMTAVVPLRCQRSLAQYEENLCATSKVVIVQSDAEAERIDEAHEPVQLDDKLLALRELVEEELLLALPLVPVNPDAQLPDEYQMDVSEEAESEQVEGITGETRKAFAGLADMLARNNRE